MDRTSRMLRRTLLCAVFACPLALWRLDAALLLQGLWTALLVAPVPAVPALWAKGRRSPRAALRRAIWALLPALLLAAVLDALTRPLLSPFLRPAARALAALSGLVAQAGLIYRFR